MTAFYVFEERVAAALTADAVLVGGGGHQHIGKLRPAHRSGQVRAVQDPKGLDHLNSVVPGGIGRSGQQGAEHTRSKEKRKKF